MPPKKASAEPAAAIPNQPDTQRKDTKPEVSEDSGSKAAGRKVSHPSTMEMVTAALKALDSRKGVSAQAIRGFITEKHASVDEKRLKFMVRRSLMKGLETGVIVRPASSGPNTTGAQGRFRIVKTKAKDAKAQAKENADPNTENTARPTKVKVPKAKSDGTSKDAKEPKKKPQVTDDAELKTAEGDGSASKVAPAKKPKTKNAAGEGGTEPKPSKAKKPKASKKESVEEPAAAKKGKKTAVKNETGEKTAVKNETGEKTGAPATKASGKRGKK